MRDSYTVCAFWSSARRVCRAVKYFDAAAITCYNFGQCDGSGTCVVCSKYSINGLQFFTYDGTTTSLQLPLAYTIRNVRAVVGQCCHWSEGDALPTRFRLVYATENIDVSEGDLFHVLVGPTNTSNRDPIVYRTNEHTSVLVGGWADSADNAEIPLSIPVADFYIEPRTGETFWWGDVVTKCDVAMATKQWNEGGDGEFPCNGVNTNCQFYVGPKFQHLTESKLVTGAPITAKQIQELRFYSDNWAKYENPVKAWADRWKDPYIWAWPESKYATDVEGNKRLKVTRVFISDYETGDMSTEEVLASSGTPYSASEVDYPTLIREVTETLDSPIRITYPFGPVATYEHFTYDKNRISIFGQTFRDTTVFAVNQALSTFPNPEKLKNSDIGVKLAEFIEKGNKYVYDAVSDEGGFFEFIKEIELQYAGESPNGANVIYVFVLSPFSGKWLYDKIIVNFKFHHVIVAQTEFSSLDAYDTTLNNATIKGRFITLPNSSVADMQFDYTHTPVGGGSATYYNYTEKITVENDVVFGEYWQPVSRCGAIAVEMPYTYLSRVIPDGVSDQWVITSATLIQRSPYNNGKAENIPLEVYYKESDGYGFPAHAVLLKPKDGSRLSSPDPSTDELRISFVYYLERQAPYVSGELAPAFVGKTIASSIPMSINLSYSGFTISHVSLFNQSYSVYVSSNGRYIGRKRVRFLVQTRDTYCRDVEIFYAWRALYNNIKLLPDWYRVITDSDGFKKEVIGTSTVTFVPNCGDHDIFSYTNVGPLWYPYNVCGTPKYSVSDINFTSTENITQASVGTSIIERLHGPDAVYPVTLDTHYTIFDCFFDQTFGNKEIISGVEFIGYAAFRGPVDESEYVLRDWDLPIFGNKGREYSRMLQHIEYKGYYDPDGLISYRWMPILPNYSEALIASEAEQHPFTYLMCSSVGGSGVNEEENTTLYEFNEVFINRFSPNIAYPGINYLDFKFGTRLLWCWEVTDPGVIIHSAYPDIITGISFSTPSNVLDRNGFVVSTKPDTGVYTLLFTPPVYDDFGVMEEKASIKLQDGPAREFDITTGDLENNGVYATSSVPGGGYVAYSNLFSSSLLNSYSTEDGTTYFYPGVVMSSIDVSKLPSIPINLLNADNYFLEYKYSVAPSTWGGYNSYLDGTSSAPESAYEYRDTEYGSTGALLSTDPKNILTVVFPASPESLGVPEETFMEDLDMQIEPVDITIKLNIPTRISAVYVDVLINQYYELPNTIIYGSNNEATWTAIGSIPARKSGDGTQFIYSDPLSALVGDIIAYKYIKVSFWYRGLRKNLGIFSIRVEGRAYRSTAMDISVDSDLYYVSTGDYGDMSLHSGEDNRVFFNLDNASDYFKLSSATTNSFTARDKSNGHSALEQHSDFDEAYGGIPYTQAESLQKSIYYKAQSLLDGVTMYNSYIPAHEDDFFRTKLGVTIPRWTLTMTSELSDFETKYGSIVTGTPWSAPGHEFFHDERTVGKVGCFLGESSIHIVFDYALRHINHGSGQTVSAFSDAFYSPSGSGSLIPG